MVCFYFWLELLLLLLPLLYMHTSAASPSSIKEISREAVVNRAIVERLPGGSATPTDGHELIKINAKVKVFLRSGCLFQWTFLTLRVLSSILWNNQINVTLLCHNLEHLLPLLSLVFAAKKLLQSKITFHAGWTNLTWFNPKLVAILECWINSLSSLRHIRDLAQHLHLLFTFFVEVLDVFLQLILVTLFILQILILYLMDHPI